MESLIDLSAKKLRPFTLIYLKNKEQVLLLKRNRNKEMVPDKWLGLGGKIEPGEDLFDSAKREFREESGLTLTNLVLRGTFSWIEEKQYAGIAYIFVATEYQGNLLADCNEGELEWQQISSIDQLADLASHQHFFLQKMLTDDAHFYSGIAVYNKGNLISYVDNSEFFEERKRINKEI